MLKNLDKVLEHDEQLFVIKAVSCTFVCCACGVRKNTTQPWRETSVRITKIRYKGLTLVVKGYLATIIGNFSRVDKYFYNNVQPRLPNALWKKELTQY